MLLLNLEQILDADSSGVRVVDFDRRISTHGTRSACEPGRCQTFSLDNLRFNPAVRHIKFTIVGCDDRIIALVVLVNNPKIEEESLVRLAIVRSEWHAGLVSSELKIYQQHTLLAVIVFSSCDIVVFSAGSCPDRDIPEGYFELAVFGNCR